MSAPFPRFDAAPAWYLSVVFDLDAHHPFFLASGWRSRFAGRIPLPANVDAAGQVTPEGLLMRYRCNICSARAEILTDFRSLNELYYGHPSSPMDFSHFGTERAHGIERLLLAREAQAWGAAHAECEPVSLPLAPVVRKAFQGLRGDAAQALRDTGEIPAVHAVVLDTGRVLYFDADGSTPERQALTAFRVREAVRQSHRSEIMAAVTAAEAATERGTEWRVGVVASGYGWIGRAEVDRFDHPAPGPGVLSEPVWRPLTEDHDALDGLVVQRQCFPLPRNGFGAQRVRQRGSTP